MHKLPWEPFVDWTLIAFFLLGGYMNMFPSNEVTANYERWGYPDWFHIVTGVLEWTAALLLTHPLTRIFGASLGAIIMFAAASTLLSHGEYIYALSPSAVLFGATVVGASTYQNIRPK